MVQRIKLNTEKAYNMEVGSARRMKGNLAEISLLKPQYTDFCFMEIHSSTIVSSHGGVGYLAVFIMTVPAKTFKT